MPKASLAAGATLAAGPCAAGAQAATIANGSFEDPRFAPGVADYAIRSSTSRR